MAVLRADQSLSNIFDFFKVYGIQIWFLVLLAFLIFTVIGLGVRFVEFKLGLRSNLNLVEVNVLFPKVMSIIWCSFCGK